MRRLFLSLFLLLALAHGAMAYTLFDETFTTNASFNTTWNTQEYNAFTFQPYVQGGQLQIQPDTGSQPEIYQTAMPTNWTELSSNSTRPLTLSVVMNLTMGSGVDHFYIGFNNPENGSTFGGLSGPQMHLGAPVNPVSLGSGQYNNWSRWDVTNFPSAYNLSISPSAPAPYGEDIAPFGGIESYFKGYDVNTTLSVWSNGTACGYAFVVGNTSANSSIGCWSYLVNTSGGTNPLQSLGNFTAAIGFVGNGYADNLWHPHQIDRATLYYGSGSSGGSGAQACSDSTPSGSCSTTQYPYLCTQGVLSYDPNVCQCPAGQVPDGSGCVTLPDQPKVQVPVALITWDHGVCYDYAGTLQQGSGLLGVVGSAIGGFFGGVGSAVGITGTTLLGQNGTVSAIREALTNAGECAVLSTDAFAQGDTVMARYVARTDQRIITNLTGVFNSIRVNSVICNETYTSALPPFSQVTVPMVYDSITGNWNSSFKHSPYTEQGANVTVQCSSSIPNSYLSAKLILQNTPINARGYAPIGKAGYVNGIDADPNRADVQDRPIAFRIETNGGHGATTLRYGGNLWTESASSAYTAPFCALSLQNASLFSGTTGETFTSGYATKSLTIAFASTQYLKTVSNHPAQAGDYPYLFTCIPTQTNVRQASISLRDSLTVNSSCAGQVLSSDLSVSYAYAGANLSTGTTGDFYYGVAIAPSVTYRTLNGTAPLKNLRAFCTLAVSNGTGTLKTFTAQATNGDLRFGSLTFPYANGYLPTGSYTFQYDCTNDDRRFCAASASLTQPVNVNNTPAACTGVPDDCGINSCSVCAETPTTCEDGETISVQQACMSQTCTNTGQYLAARCTDFGHDIYGVKIDLPLGTAYACQSPIKARATLTKRGVPATDITSYCRFSVLDNFQTQTFQAGELLEVNTPEIETTLNTSTLACGQNYAIRVTCDSNIFNSTKTDTAINTRIYSDVSCQVIGKAVKSGTCLSATTGKDADNPKFCSEGVIIDSPTTCGCPNGLVATTQNLNGTILAGCARPTGSQSAQKFVDWFWGATFIGVGGIVFLIFIWPFLGHFLEKTGILGVIKRIFMDEEAWFGPKRPEMP